MRFLRESKTWIGFQDRFTLDETGNTEYIVTNTFDDEPDRYQRELEYGELSPDGDIIDTTTITYAELKKKNPHFI